MGELLTADAETAEAAGAGGDKDETAVAEVDPHHVAPRVAALLLRVIDEFETGETPQEECEVFGKLMKLAINQFDEKLIQGILSACSDVVVRLAKQQTLADYSSNRSHARVLLEVLAYGIAQTNCALPFSTLIQSVTLLIRLSDDFLLPSCSWLLLSILSKVGLYGGYASWVDMYGLVLEKTCQIIAANPVFQENSDRNIANLIQYFHRAIPIEHRNKSLAQLVIFLCSQCIGMRHAAQLHRVACEILIDLCLPENGYDGYLVDMIAGILNHSCKPTLLRHAMNVLLKESEHKLWLEKSESAFSRQQRRKRSNSELLQPEQAKKKKIEGGLAHVGKSDDWITDSLANGSDSHLDTVEMLKKFCLEAESMTNVTDRRGYLSILVFLLALGRNILDKSILERIERSVWHILSLYENDLNRRNKEDKVVLQILRIVSPFAAFSFLPRSYKSKFSVNSLLLAPWNMQNAGKGFKLDSLKIGVAVSWYNPRYKQLLELGMQDQHDHVRAATMIAAPVLIGKPHCLHISKFFAKMSRDASEMVRSAIGHSIAIAYVLDFDLQQDEKLEIVSLVKRIISDSNHSILELVLSFQKMLRRRWTLNLKSKNYFALSKLGMVTKYLLFSEQDEDVHLSVLQSLKLIFSCCHSKEVAGSGAFLLELLDWILVQKARGSISRRFHAVSSELLLPMVSKPFVEEMFPNSKSCDIQFLQYLRGILQKSTTPNAKQLVLEAIASIGTTLRSQDSLLIALVLLMGFLDDDNWSLKSAATRGLKQIADANKTSLASLVSKNPRTLEYIGRNLVNKPRLAKEAADILMNCDEKSLLIFSMPFVLPRLIELQDTKALEALTVSVQANNLSEMLLEYGHHAMAEIVVVGGEIKVFINYMEKLTGWPFSSQLEASLHKLLMQVLWKASDVDILWKNYIIPDDVLDQLKVTLGAIAAIVEKMHPPTEASPSNGDSDNGTFLQSEYISMMLKGVSDHLKENAHKTLVTSISPNKEVQAIRCLNIMIELSGHHVKEFTPGFLALLTKGLEVQDEQAKIHAVQGLTYFVDALAHSEPTQLKRIVEPIVVALLPFLELSESPGMHHAVIRLMEMLVVKYHDEVQTKLQRFPLLPSTSNLTKVNDAIKKSKGQIDEAGHLRAIVESLDHDAISVKYSALGELKSFLVRQQEWINRLFTSTEEKDKTLVNDLLYVLFKCSNLRSKCSLDFSLRCLECLGEVGAIDPRKCRLNISIEESLKMVMKSKKSLPATLIAAKLSKVLSSTTDLDALDATAYAIQQILKYYGQQNRNRGDNTQESSRNATQSGLWNELSEDVQGVIRPLLKSKYQLTTRLPEKMPVPIIGLLNLSYERWLLLWMRHLITCVPHDHEFKHLFDACSGMLKYDLSTILFLLPYLILVVVTCGSTEALDSIKAELNAAVLQGSLSVQSNKRDKQDGDESFFTLSMQTIFSLLDQFSNWLEFTKQVVNKKMSTIELNKSLQSLAIPATARSTERVSLLLNAVPQIRLAQAAYHSGAHARALKHYEMHLKNEKKCHGFNPPAFHAKFDIDDNDLSFLIGTYSHLEEPDGIGGLIKMRKESRLSDKTLAAEMAGNWSEVLAIYEEALQTGKMQDSSSENLSAGVCEPISEDERGYLRCLLNMGHHQALITHISGLTAQFQDKSKTQQLSSYGVASALRLGRWSLINDLKDLSDVNDAKVDGLDFDIQVASLLEEVPGLVNSNEETFKNKLQMVRKELLGPLSASSMESYLRVYPVLRRLQVLQELEHAYSFISDFASKPKKSNLNLRHMEKQLGWKERLERTQPSLTTREPIMAVRRAIISFWIPKAEALSKSEKKNTHLLGGQEQYIGSHFLEYAKLCRKAGYHEAAQIAILKAESINRDIDASLSKAKLLWDMDKKLDAILELKSSLRQSDCTPHETAKKMLHLANWSSQTGHEQESNLKSLYEKAILCDTEWEKGYFFFAKYLDDLMRDAQQREKLGSNGTGVSGNARGSHSMRVSRLKHFSEPKKHYEYVPLVLKNYGECIQHGTKTIYQSMPRMLTVWFEFGNEVVHMEKMRKPMPKEVTFNVFDCMSSFLKKVPQAVWLAALPQLISRVCHPHPDVLKFTKHILSRTLHAYPNQVLWALATLVNSNVPQRRKSAREIITAARKRADENKRQLFLQFDRVIDELIKLCHHAPSGKTKTFSISQNFRSLERMMPLDILIPVQNFLTLALPPNGDPFKNDSNGSSSFESSLSNVTIVRIFDEVEILSSLQKPKVIKVLGSDGMEYRFLCKPKDDLRKDTRMMEFANVLNHLLATKSHHLGNASRDLYIRTFAVMPLTEDCGMIEWIENTRGFRHCCQDVYVQEKLFDRKTNKQIKETYDSYFRTANSSSKRDGFHSNLLDKVLSRFPPKLHKWFLQHFPEPSMWLESRLRFARSCAVWSVCGHVVGLGDRHGENVLIDSRSGDCVHVDFSCLFDKGLALEKPEVVPFRLTQNMIDAMGISGYEGVFRKSCETTLRVLRSNKETLLNVLDTFVHDPLVEWTNSSSTDVNQAREALNNIASRLDGVVVGVNANPSLPLSAEGQTDRLIAEATSKENLGMMYIW